MISTIRKFYTKSYSIKEYNNLYMKQTNERVNRELYMQANAIKAMVGITISGFTGMYIHSTYMFKQVDKKFEQVDKKFEQVDKRMDMMESDIKDIKKTMTEILIAIKK